MKANYENDPLIQEGKEKAKKYAQWAKENKVESLNDWTPLEEGTELDSGMTMYDMAKQGAAAAPPLEKEALQELEQKLVEFIIKHLNRYFMLLCHEKRDYTIFRLGSGMYSYSTVAADILECLLNRGDLVEYEVQEDLGGVELWVKNSEGEGNAYYFFPYGEAVIEYGE